MKRALTQEATSCTARRPGCRSMSGDGEVNKLIAQLVEPLAFGVVGAPG